MTHQSGSLIPSSFSLTGTLLEWSQLACRRYKESSTIHRAALTKQWGDGRRWRAAPLGEPRQHTSAAGGPPGPLGPVRPLQATVLLLQQACPSCCMMAVSCRVVPGVVLSRRHKAVLGGWLRVSIIF